MASYTYAGMSHPDHDIDIPCKCCRLDMGLDLPVPKRLSVKEIKVAATAFSHTIFADWTQLNAIVKRFEAVIRKRWLKKSAKQRRELLLTVQPNMPLVHRRDFEGFRNLSNSRLSREITCEAGSHLTPYINVEDLIQGHNLLLFIHSRGRNLPRVFASTDAMKAHLGWGWPLVPDMDGIAMLLDVGTAFPTPRRYGALFPVSRLPPQIGVNHSYDPMYGLLTLEIQQSIYSFLRQCVQKILHDMDPADYRLAPHQPVPEPLVNPSSVWDTASVRTLQADYRTPREKTSLLRLKLLIDGRRLTAEDHVRSLREDPGYFLEHLKEWREHFPYRFEDMGCSPVEDWRMSASIVVSKALDALHTWTWVNTIINAMRPIELQAKDAIDGLRLQASDELLWVMLDESIEMMISTAMCHMARSFPMSSGLRKDMRPHKPGSCKTRCTNGAQWGWHIRKGAPHPVWRVCKLFHMLAGLDRYQLELHGLRPIAQEAHHMLENDTEASQLVDDWLLTDFFDIAVLADLRECVRGFHPYSCSWDAADVARTSAAHDVEEVCKRSRELVHAARQASCESTSLGIPTDGRFEYPSDKRRTAENVRQLQRAEANLKTWWTEQEARMARCGILLGGFFKMFLKNTPDVHSTQDWEMEPTDTTAIPVLRSDMQYQRPVTLHTGNENKKTQIEPERKIKQKTQGAQPAGAAAAARDPSPVNVNATAKGRQPVCIPRRTFKVMSALLPSPSTISQAPREVSWDDFVHALHAIGFVPEKLYGSVWIFKPLPEGEGLVSVDRSIQFHEPKGVRRGGKIDLIIVRQFGDRLKRAFGWDGETFACA